MEKQKKVLAAHGEASGLEDLVGLESKIKYDISNTSWQVPWNFIKLKSGK